MGVERKFVKEKVGRLLVRDFVRKQTERAGFGGLDIQRTPLGTRITIVAERPGMVIGRRGSTINQLTADLDRRFPMDNPQISVEEPEDNAALNAQIMAIKVAESLERGWHFRRVGHSTVQRIMGAGALGCIVEIAGKVTGQRKRREKFIAGHVKYCGETAYELMDEGHAQCKKKLGTIGCTVRIMKKGAHLPDHVEILKPGQKAEAAAEAQAAQAAQAAGVETVAAGEKKAGDKPSVDLPANLNKLTIADLKELAAKHSFDLTGKTLKADIIAAIQEQAQAASGGEGGKTEGGKGRSGRRERRSFTVGGGDQ